MVAEIRKDIASTDVISGIAGYVLGFGGLAQARAADIKAERQGHHQIKVIQAQLKEVRHGYLHHPEEPPEEAARADLRVSQQYHASIKKIQGETPHVDVAAVVGDAFGMGLAWMVVLGVTANRIRHIRQERDLTERRGAMSDHLNGGRVPVTKKTS